MDFTKVGVICIALGLLTYAQVLERPPFENYTVATISPLEVGQYEQVADIEEETLESSKLEGFTTATISHFVYVAETENRPFEANQTENTADLQGNSTVLEELHVSYIDENGNEVDDDTNLYFCKNCKAGEEEDVNENNYNNKLLCSVSEEDEADGHNKTENELDYMSKEDVQYNCKEDKKAIENYGNNTVNYSITEEKLAE